MKTKEFIQSIEQTEWSENVVIATKQFMGSQVKFDWTIQSGKINYETLLFTPDHVYHKGRVGPHRVQFHTISDFVSSLYIQEG